MALKELTPWRWGGLRRREMEAHPFLGFRDEMIALHREMDRLFEGIWENRGRPVMPEVLGFSGIALSLDETEDERAYHVSAELPGLEESAIEVTLADGLLTIKGEKKRESQAQASAFYRKERAFGSFQRTIAIPGEVDESAITASFKKGVLKIDLPKSEEAQKKVTHIEVQAA
jgi:HSP20 family protein